MQGKKPKPLRMKGMRDRSPIIINEFGQEESFWHWSDRHKRDLITRQNFYGEREDM